MFATQALDETSKISFIYSKIKFIILRVKKTVHFYI